MDSKKIYYKLGISFCFLFLINGCSEEEKKTDSYYVEFVNFNNDSLKKDVTAKTLGKATFYRNNKMEIISINYVTDNLKEPHYFLDPSGLGPDIKEETRKIRVEFLEPYSTDSIKYLLQKFTFKDNTWQKTSDMGTMRVFRTVRTDQNIISNYGDQIHKSIIMYTYDR